MAHIHPHTRIGFALSVIGVAVAAAGCAPGTADDSSAEATVVSEEVLADLRAELDEAKAQPEFEPAGEAFSVADLAGKKILSMPTSSQLEGCDSMARTVVELAKGVGMTESSYFQNDGGPDAWTQGMNMAINQGYDGVALVCGIDPAALAPQMQAAEAAGIEVVDMHLADVSDPPSELVTAQTSGQFNRAMRLGVAQSLVESEGKPVDALVITSNENPPSVGMERAVQDEYARLCGEECGVESINVPITDYATDLTGAVSSALVKNPDIRAVFVVFDAQTPFVLPAIKASGVDAKTYAFGGDKTFISMMTDESNPMGTDMGPNYDWMSYTGADQLFRAMVGEKTIPAEEAYSPYRLWTPENVDELQPPHYGFGDSYVEGYQNLWLNAPAS